MKRARIIFPVTRESKFTRSMWATVCSSQTVNGGGALIFTQYRLIFSIAYENFVASKISHLAPCPLFKVGSNEMPTVGLHVPFI